jgi:hypothetical protein
MMRVNLMRGAFSIYALGKKNKSPLRKRAGNVKAANGVCSKEGLANRRR